MYSLLGMGWWCCAEGPAGFMFGALVILPGPDEDQSARLGLLLLYRKDAWNVRRRYVLASAWNRLSRPHLHLEQRLLDTGGVTTVGGWRSAAIVGDRSRVLVFFYKEAIKPRPLTKQQINKKTKTDRSPGGYRICPACCCLRTRWRKHIEQYIPGTVWRCGGCRIRRSLVGTQ